MSVRFGSPSEAAFLLGCSVQHVYYLLRMSQISATKIRWIYRIDMETVEDYAARRPQEAPARNASPHPGCPGYLFDLERLGQDGHEGNYTGKRTTSLPDGRRLEHRPRRLHRLPVTPQHIVQLELAIA